MLKKIKFLPDEILIQCHVIYTQEIPIVVAGNKSDLNESNREVRIEDVSEWVYCELPKLK